MAEPTSKDKLTAAAWFLRSRHILLLNHCLAPQS